MTSTVVILVLVVMATGVLSHPKIFDKDDEPAFSCPADEQYYTCSQIHCYKTCKDLKEYPPCPSVTPDCYNPACECKDDTFRNDEGVCVPRNQCNKPTN